MNTINSLYIICSFVYFFMGLSIIFISYKDKENRIFFYISVGLSFWALMYGLMGITENPKMAFDFRQWTIFSWSFIYAIILDYTIYLTKKEKIFKKKWHHFIVFFPAVICFYLYFFEPGSINDIMKTEYGWIFLKPEGRDFLWYHFFEIYCAVYILATLILLFNWRLKTHINREKKQSTILLFSFALTFLLGFFSDVLLPMMGYKSFPSMSIIFIIVCIFGIWYSRYKYGLMSITTERIVLDVLKIMNEGLIALNEDGKIISINDGALNLLEYSEEEIKGKPLDIVFSEKYLFKQVDSFHSFEANIITKDDKEIPVLISSTVLLDNCGDKIGTLLIFQNHMKIKEYENRLMQAKANLEARVLERTYKLNITNSVLQSEIKRREEKEKEIEKLVYEDQLTKLANRRWFYKKLEDTILETSINESLFAILYIDVDSFKMINDTFGHSLGDMLLIAVGERLKEITGENSDLARVGGDEFLIILRDFDDRENIEDKCREISEFLSKPFRFTNKEIHINVSIGVAVYKEHGEDVETLIKNADVAMYKAKSNKNKSFVIFDSDMSANLVQIMKLTNDLYHALELNEFEVYYQPQVNIKSGKIVGLEALIRWQHAKLGTISPVKFIHIAEETGLILPIGEWVLRTVCMQMKKWQEEGRCNISVAVNLSVNQLHSFDFAERVSNIIEETAIDPKFLELEITESILMKDIDIVVDALSELKKLNIKIAIDDFGTEYSGLSYLKKLPIDRIKIPKGFIDGIGESLTDEAIISSVVVLGKRLGLNVIAEGVEEEKQQQFLRDIDCDEIQGYYYYKPMPAREVEKYLEQ